MNILPNLAQKVIWAILLGLSLLYPVYRFIFIITARKYSVKEFEVNKNKIKKKAIILSILITTIFSFFYCIKVF